MIPLPFWTMYKPSEIKRWVARGRKPAGRRDLALPGFRQARRDWLESAQLTVARARELQGWRRPLR